jgi:hypothetical protein
LKEEQRSNYGETRNVSGAFQMSPENLLGNSLVTDPSTAEPRNMSDPVLPLIDNFLEHSKNSIDALMLELHHFVSEEPGEITFFTMEGNKRRETQWNKGHFFLRASTEYANPQLTLEELQGIIAARLLETCCNYMIENKVSEPSQIDVKEISERLKKPPKGAIVPFLLNTDDVEPDRYSINPLRASIVESGQSAFPAASVATDGLKTDPNFLAKYEGSLISHDEIALIEDHLRQHSKYLDFVDAVKYDMLRKTSDSLGIDLCIPAYRMPLDVLKNEKPGHPMHKLIQSSHHDYDTIGTIYELMGRNIGKRKTLLLTVPHSPKGFGSKRAAQGSIMFKQDRFEQIKVQYKTTPLYANELDVQETDVSVAKADDNFSVEAEKIANYDYSQTPSSPQFALYAILSPEDASIWHGIGVFGGVELVRSIVSIRSACLRKTVLGETVCRGSKSPLQLNLIPEAMWRHPKYGNIDTSVGCVQDLTSVVKNGIHVAPLSVKERISE